MGAPERFQGFARWPNTALLYIFKSLTDSLRGIGLRGDIEEALISFGILHDRFRLAIDSKNQRSFGLLEMLHELPRIAPESGHGLNVFFDVEHAILTSL
jgi:hypothetical protein